MKYILLSPRKIAQKVLNEEPSSGAYIEVSDEIASNVQELLDNKQLPIYIENEFETLRTLVSEGKRITFNKLINEYEVIVIPAIVPQEVPLWAFREVVFIDDNLKSAYDTLASNLNDARINNFVEYGNYIDRNSATLIALANALGKDAAYIDSVFIRASKKKL